MDVNEGYRPRRPTVKASGAAQAAGQIGGPPEAAPVERYAPGMGYPGDEGSGPPDSRLDTPAGRGGGRREETAGRGSDPRERARSGSHRRLAGDAGGPPTRENAWRRPDRRPGQEIQGGPGSTAASGGSPSRGSLWSAGAFRTAGPGGRGPVRGFPPAPGAPDPVYPPGQFSPWNAPALRTVGAAGRPGPAAGAGPDPSEPEYSLLAVSDPSADTTATQTWAVLDDALLDEWSAAPARSGPGESPSPGAGEGTQDGPRGFFEPASGTPAASGYGAPPGHADQAGPDGGPGKNGFPGGTGLAVEAGYPGLSQPAARPGGRLAARQALQQGTADTQDRGAGAGGTRESRSAARGRKPRKPRRPPSRARMWLMPLVMMGVVIAGITVAYLHFAQGPATPAAAGPTPRPATASGSASPSLGPWQHITTRADDLK